MFTIFKVFRSCYFISHVTKNKIWCQFCDVIFLLKTLKSKKNQKCGILGNNKLHTVTMFHVN